MAKGKTLSEQLIKEAASKIAKDYDIEDDVNYNSSGDESEESEDELKRDHYVKVDKSKLRGNSVSLDPKYTGKKTSRSELFESSHIDEDEDDDEDDEDDEEEGDDDDEEDEDEEDEEDDDEIKRPDIDSEDDILADVTDSEDEENENEDDDSSDDSDNEASKEENYKRNKLNELLNQEKKNLVSRLSSTAKSDALKGYSIIQQQRVYDKILDSRIKLQKALTASNQLPLQKETLDVYKTKKTQALIDQIQDSLSELLYKVLNTRVKLINNDKIVKEEIKRDNNNDNSKSKKRNLKEFLNETSELDEIVNTYGKNVLTKWSNKIQAASGSTALNSGKFKTINQNTYVQVKSHLSDMDRLVKRTRLNRRNVKPLGFTEDDLKENGNEDDDNDEDDDNEDEDDIPKERKDATLQETPIIFDDEDFYRVLLNDMVDKKISDKQATSTSAIITMTTNKIHKSYDRKATKGRKLKFTSQEPLEHFEAPKQHYYAWNDDQIDEFFASLLGQKVNFNEVSDAEESDNDEEGDDEINLKNTALKLFG
ncbi:hypothetical protein BVG19_g3565 [[Candida] boidinii]|nr:hypothetical protein BVG19_g3565 [[Candida] boidinii]OWB49584.1 hypothetical protein B5S27_g1125 [[Candida] boidinii]